MGTSFTVDYNELHSTATQIETIAAMLDGFGQFSLDRSGSSTVAEAVRHSADLIASTLKNLGEEFVAIASDVRKTAAAYAAVDAALHAPTTEFSGAGSLGYSGTFSGPFLANDASSSVVRQGSRQLQAQS